MLKEEKVYGIISIDSTEAGLGNPQRRTDGGRRCHHLRVSGKTRKGGQALVVMRRAREMELTYYFNRVGEHVARVFINDTRSRSDRRGPGPTKEDFLKGGYLHYQLQNNILAVIDSSYAGREVCQGARREGGRYPAGRQADRGEETCPTISDRRSTNLVVSRSTASPESSRRYRRRLRTPS